MLYFKCFVMDKIATFCYRKSHGKINVTSLIQLQSTSFFLESIYLVFYICLKYLKSFKMAP